MMNKALQICLPAFQLLSRGVSWVLTLLFGEVSWQAPGWLKKLALWLEAGVRWMRAKPKQAGIALLAFALVATGGTMGWHWYQAQPKPQRVSYVVTAPALTPYDEKDRPQPLPLVVEFNESAAPLKQIDQPAGDGVQLSPALAGSWVWEGDRKLVFRPKADWPIDAEFEVSLAKKKLFAESVKLEEYSFTFKTAPFAANVAESRFYQDPRDANLKKLVATLHFSHPVDPASIQKNISLKLGGGLSYLSDKVPPYSISFDKAKLNAFIHSAPLTVPKEDSDILLTLAKGAQAAQGGNALDEELISKISVPGLYSLRFDKVQMLLADNERYEPEQVVMLSSNVPVSEAALKGKVRAWLLPEYPPNTPKEDQRGVYQWGASQVGQAVLTNALPLKALPGEEEYGTQHSWKFSAPVGRSVFLQVDAGVQAFGGYQSGKVMTQVFQVAPYPKAIKLLSNGALLSMASDKKVAFVARGLSGVRIEVGRLLPNQLHHLVDQNNGNFAKPEIADQYLDTLVERFTEERTLPATDPGKPYYDSIDLTRYLADKTGSRRGVFMLKLTPFDPKAPKNREDEPSDSRFILVSDLGVLAKTAVDNSNDVFVQSISSGEAVAAATVEVIGRNGQTVASSQTDALGRAHFPALKDLAREKAPLMYLVKQGDDVSFLPINRYDRQLNLSRFDIGGVANAVSAQQLSSFVFSDRGMYRPGETAHIHSITRTANWAGSLAGLPLEIEITDPRGQTVKKDKIKLSASGFDSVDFASSETSPSGDYQIGVYLVKGKERGEQIGSGSIKIKEFEPDRMKVNATLSNAPVEGWISPTDIKANVKVMHLFGSPAGGRRVEGEMILTPSVPAFAAFAQYRFSEAGQLKEPFRDALPSATSNDQGDAELTLNLARFARSTYQLHLTARAFESGSGRGVAAESAVLVSSAPYLVGVKSDGELGYIQRNAKRAAHWLAIAPNLKPIAAEQLTLSWVERKYVSVLVKQPDETYKYQSRKKEINRDSKPLNLPASGSNLTLPTAEPGDFALVVRGPDGAELNRIEYTVVGAANIARSLERNAELQLTLNKKDYKPGDEIEINIRAPYTGAGLITIERDKVYSHVWFKADTTSSVQKITLPKDFEGNGYISVQFIRSPSSDEVYMSPLSYGVVPFAVNLDARRLDVKIANAKEVKPGQKLELKVSSNQEARVVVFAVDEGILQVARYKTPQPLDFFFQKRALDVRTSQILDLILPEFSRLMQGAAPGGDAAGALGKHLNPFKRKRQSAVAWWSGLIDVGPQGKTLSYTVPDTFNGKLRLMAVAVTADKIGVFEGGTQVRGDLILSPNVPYALAPGDEFTVSVGVFNNLRAPGKAAVQLKLDADAAFTLISPALQNLSIDGQREANAEFRLKANAVLGSGSLRFTASSGGKQGIARDAVSIRPAVPYSTKLTVGRFDKSSEEVALSRVLFNEHRKVIAGVAGSPLVWAQGLANYLDGYGYSCTEQVISKGFPALLLPNLDRAKTQAAFSKLIQILAERQNDDGSFGLWASNPDISRFASVYAVHYLLEASERGLPVSRDMLARSNAWLEQLATGSSQNLAEARERAYAIYLLSRQGTMTSGMIASLQQELDAHHAKTWQQDLTAAYLATSYKLLKQDALANKLFKAVPWRLLGKNNQAETYYDPTVHDAQRLYLLARHFKEQLGSVPANELGELGKAISSQNYHSLSAAYLMLGLEAFGANAGTFTLAEVDKNGKVSRLENSAALSPSAHRARFGKESALPGFYLLSESGFDKTPPSAAIKQGVEVIREYTDLAGKVISKVKIGEEFLVRLRLRADQPASQMAIVELLPGGVEIVPSPKEEAPEVASEGEGEGEGEAPQRPAWQAPLGEKQSNWRPDYLDMRDDRIVLYGSISKDAATFVYRLRATHAGVFTSPAPYAEGMYSKQQGRGVAGKLEIVKP
jgi:alpha-2-macroglobulin